MTTNSSETEVSPVLSVGELLRQAREQRQLTLEDVAKQLKLKVEVLRSLESDQPDKAILPTFMRGYLKSYARFLKLPEQDVLHRFEQTHQLKSSPVKMMRTFSNGSVRQRVERRFIRLTWLLVTLLIVFLVSWFWQSARETPVLSEVSEVAPVIINDTTDQALVATLERLEELRQEFEQQTPPSASSVGEEPAIVTALPDLMSPEDAVANDEPQAERFGDVSNQLLDQLKMSFTDNCWIDVLDANGDRIAFGTKEAGYVMELNAKGPFVITLGNPGVVSIEINQQPYDMSRFPGNRVAKFTLSGQND